MAAPPTLGNVLASLRSTTAPKIQAITKGLILIAGEQVQIDERGFNPSKYTDRVSFTEKYFPNATAAELLSAVRVYSELFGGPNPMTLSNPVPPCNKDDMEILIEGLTNRFQSLSDDIEMLEGVQRDTDTLRTKIQQLSQLKGFIDNAQANSNKKVCNLAKNENVVGFDDSQNTANRKMQNLLRKFAILVLQNQTPLASYKGTTKDSKTVVDILGKNPVSRADLTKYLDEWEKATKSKIPISLAEVLNATGDTPGAIEKAVEKAREQDAAAAGAAALSSGGGLQEGGSTSPIVTQEVTNILSSSEPPATQVAEIVTAIKNELSTSEDNNADLTADNNLKGDRIADLDAKVIAANQALQKSQEALGEIQQKYDTAQKEVIATTKTAAQKEAQLQLITTQFKASLDDANRVLQDLELKRQEATSAAAAAEKELAITQQDAADAAIETTRVKAVADSTQTALESTKSTVVQQTYTINALEAQLAQTVAALEELKNRFALVQKGVTVIPTAAAIPTAVGGGESPSIPDPELIAEINELNMQVTDLTGQLAAARIQAEELKNTVLQEEENTAIAKAEKDTEAAAWQQQMQVLQEGNAILKTNSTDTAALESQINNLNKKHLAMIDESAKKDAQIAELKATAIALQSSSELENSNCDEQKGILKSEVTNLNTQLSAAADMNSKQVADLNANIKSLSNQLRDAAEEGGALKGLLTLAEQNLAALTKEVKAEAESAAAAAEHTKKEAEAAAAAAAEAGNEELAAAERAVAAAAAKEAAAAKVISEATPNELVNTMHSASEAATTLEKAEDKVATVIQVSPPAPPVIDNLNSDSAVVKAADNARVAANEANALSAKAALAARNDPSKQPRANLAQAVAVAEDRAANKSFELQQLVLDEDEKDAKAAEAAVATADNKEEAKKAADALNAQVAAAKQLADAEAAEQAYKKDHEQKKLAAAAAEKANQEAAAVALKAEQDAAKAVEEEKRLHTAAAAAKASAAQAAAEAADIAATRAAAEAAATAKKEADTKALNAKARALVASKILPPMGPPPTAYRLYSNPATLKLYAKPSGPAAHTKKASSAKSLAWNPSIIGSHTMQLDGGSRKKSKKRKRKTKRRRAH